MYHRFILLALGLAACGPTDPFVCEGSDDCSLATPLDTTVLANDTACTDTSVAAWSADDTRGLSIYLPELLVQANGGDLDLSGTAAELGATVVWEEGTELSTAYCSDAISAQVDRSLTLFTAQLDVHVSAAASVDASPTVTLTLSDALFEDTDGALYSVASFTVTDQPIASNWGG